MFSLSCTMSVAPTIVEVTNSRLYTHANASCAGVRPIYQQVTDRKHTRHVHDMGQEGGRVVKSRKQRRERRKVRVGYSRLTSR